MTFTARLGSLTNRGPSSPAVGTSPTGRAVSFDKAVDGIPADRRGRPGSSTQSGGARAHAPGAERSWSSASTRTCAQVAEDYQPQSAARHDGMEREHCDFKADREKLHSRRSTPRGSADVDRQETTAARDFARRRPRTYHLGRYRCAPGARHLALTVCADRWRYFALGKCTDMVGPPGSIWLNSAPAFGDHEEVALAQLGQDAAVDRLAERFTPLRVSPTSLPPVTIVAVPSIT